jgi:hypothetical protein
MKLSRLTRSKKMLGGEYNKRKKKENEERRNSSIREFKF